MRGKNNSVMRKMVKGSGILLLAFFGMVLLTTSCGKEKDTIAQVKVVSKADGSPVANLQVTLTVVDAPVLAEYLPANSETNNIGLASFNFTDQYKLGQSGFAVLDVIVTQGSNEVKSVIKIEEQVTSEVTVEWPH